MAEVLLTIGIPTRNRAHYLQDLLTAIESQLRDLPPNLDPAAVEVLVSDNASTDATGDVARAAAAREPRVKYSVNPKNIGAQGNYHKLVEDAAGRYLWIIGDDELLLPGGLRHTVETLSSDSALGLLIHFDTRYDPKIERPQRFGSYHDFIQACARVHPHALVEHTLTSSNVYRADVMDRAVARAHDATDFPHMYGMSHGLKARGGAVFVSGFRTIQVRERRAPAVDGVWPTDLERSWLAYLNSLRDLHDVPELNAQRALDHIRKELIRKITRHPVRYVRDNLGALRQPQAWWWFLKRLFFHSRTKKS